MLQQTRGIVFKTLKYSESSMIARIYTEQFGLQSYIINGIRKNKGSIRPSHLQSLNLLELVVYRRNNHNLQHIKELSCSPSFIHLNTDIAKSSIAMFIQEMLNRIITEENTSDPELFEFLHQSIHILDLEHGNLCCYPVYFLINLSKYLGFKLRENYSGPEEIFDLTEGAFAPDRQFPGYCMRFPETKYFAELQKASYETLQEINIPYASRQLLLEALLTFYRIHIPQMGAVKSHTVLHEILSTP
jgi:DNA repair protein RecO (recombination protein O)